MYLQLIHNYFLGPFDEYVSGIVVISKINGDFDVDLDETMSRDFKELRAEVTKCL